MKFTAIKNNNLISVDYSIYYYEYDIREKRHVINWM